MSTPQYNRIIRKLVVGFGNLFNDITLVRYNPDNSEAQRFVIPISYAEKEKYVQRLQGDPNLQKKVQITLPRFSFEMTGMQYDASRKQNTNIQSFVQTGSGPASQYNPVPYDFDFSLYLYVRNIEDATQVVEHILPYFTPDYTIKLNLIPELGVIKEIPIILKDVSKDVEYEGDRDSDTRLIIWTFNFTVKGFIFGQSQSRGLITHSITSIFNQITPQDMVTFAIGRTQGLGEYQTGELVYQGYSLSTATATAKVVVWNNSNLVLTNINGNFVSSLPIVGAKTNTNYPFVSHNMPKTKYAEIDTVPNPSDATANSDYTYATVITEFASGNTSNANVSIPSFSF